jgi:hypothetical protein
MHQHDADGALSDYSKAIEAQSTQLFAFFNRSFARKQKGDFEERLPI